MNVCLFHCGSHMKVNVIHVLIMPLVQLCNRSRRDSELRHSASIGALV
uniref:Uncharacterized protein n=1 Tax=Arundo donax TaxID=35708 RepID=A0A0A9BYL2_ARUDO